MHEIKGTCPIFKQGDITTNDGSEVVLNETDTLCIHALPSLLHYATILEHHWCPVELGLTTDEDSDHAYIRCLDPGRPYTEGGSVIFRIERK